MAGYRDGELIARPRRRLLPVFALMLSLGLVVGCTTEGPVDTPSASTPPDPEPTVTESSESDSETDATPLFSLECPLIAPRELLSGAAAGESYIREAEDLASEGAPTLHSTVWGTGADEVWQAGGALALARSGEDSFDTSWWGDNQTVEVDGVERFVIAIGDPPISMIQILFVIDECPYINWVGPGLTMDEAFDYAARF